MRKKHYKQPAGQIFLLREMLAFDIETTGLNPADNVVTVVCTQDFKTGERRAFEFARVRANEPQNEALLVQELVRAFDAAPSLCAFNGVQFDIPFLHTAFNLSDHTTAAWLMKTTDILESARLGMFGPAHTFSLNLLCEHNRVAVKSGSGLQAIKFAQEGKWDALLSYCADDVRILCDLYRRQLLNNPRYNSVIDLRKISHPCMYTAEQPQHLEMARLREENKSLVAELAELRQKLAVYTEFCVCLED